MVILHSCCCWRSVRQGSIACGIYTGIYYTINAVHSSYLLREEIRFLRNRTSSSLVDHNLTSGTTAVFSSLIFAFSTCGIVCTFLLLYGIYKDIKYLLIPWIFNMVFFTVVDVVYIVHGLVVHALQWNPSVAILITVDFFLNMLNFYTILCVLSQYQEYKAGRGKAVDIEHFRTSNHQFGISQPATANYLNPNYRKPPIYFDRGTPIRAPIAAETSHLKVPQLGRPRKSVKFGDNPEIERIIVSPLWEEVKERPCRGIDTVPLIDTGETVEHA